MNRKQINQFVNAVSWNSDGLVPCVVQDGKDGAILMVAYMNRLSLRKTLESGKNHFWSRSRKKLWFKGEESGNVQVVKNIYVDCDEDCLLIKVKQIGEAACHTGMRSCFYRELKLNGRMVTVGKRIFDPKKVYKK